MLRILNAVDSPWLQVTADTGNFLDNKYEQLEAIAPDTVLLQAKTYYGGGLWYENEADFDKVAKIFHKENYKGYVSLEIEGKEDAMTAVPKSLERLRLSFSYSVNKLSACFLNIKGTANNGLCQISLPFNKDASKDPFLVR